MSIEMKDLPLVPKRTWRMKVGKTIRPTTLDMFRVKFKASMLAYEQAKHMYGDDARPTKKALRTYNFYFSQIDEDQSDTFSLMMYATDEWVV